MLSVRGQGAVATALRYPLAMTLRVDPLLARRWLALAGSALLPAFVIVTDDVATDSGAASSTGVGLEGRDDVDDPLGIRVDVDVVRDVDVRVDAAACTCLADDP